MPFIPRWISYAGRRLVDLGPPRPGSNDAVRMVDLEAVGTGSVTSVVGQAGAVTGAQIVADAAVAAALAGKLGVAAGAVGTANLAAGAVTAAKVASDVATTAALTSGLAAKLDTATATATYAPKALRPRAARLLASLRDPQFMSVGPAAMASPPTFAWGTSYTLATQYQPHGRAVTLLGHNPTFDATSARSFTGSGYDGVDFILHGDAVEFGWISQQANSELIWVWVDGVPATAAPILPLATTNGGGYVGKITFGSVARRRITVYTIFTNALTTLRVAAGHSITPAPRKPRVVFLGDSFTAGAAGVNVGLTYAAVAGQALGVDAVLRGIGGTGYTTAQPFGSTTRVAGVAALSPDAVVITGSVNDDGNASAVGAAATQCYADLGAALPGVPLMVVGPQATNATDTVRAERAANVAAVRAAALAAPNVIGFADVVGTGATGVAPAAWVSGATYAQGDLVSYLGSVWRWNNGGVTAVSTPAPGSTIRWDLATWGLYGTGRVGTTTGDGSRDLLLSSDGVHLSAAGHEVLGLEVATAFRSALLAYVQA